MSIRNKLVAGGTVGLGAACIFMAFLTIIVLPFVGLLGGSAILWLLWNHALAGLFNGPQLGYWQVFGLLFLLGIITRVLGVVFHK
jgi:hypothetical protein